MTDIKKIAVLGAGQMGAGVAQIAAADGDYEVLLADIDRATADKGKAGIAKQLGRKVEKGKLEGSVRDAILGRIATVDSLKDLADADIVVEAATENIELKKELFRQLDATCKPGAILATNTSSISITLVAAVTKRPEQVIGMHFMNPVPVMKLVEIIRGLATSDEVYATTVGLAEKLGKTCVTSKDSPGFIVNRILIPLLNEACFALQEGLGTAEDIDTGAKLGLNHPMGPLELADLIGLDTCLAHVAAGWLGRKTKRGFYDYRKG
jgi:3-hydroxybutyryl-CoA dehydrogenase